MTIASRLVAGLNFRAVYANDVWSKWASGGDLPTAQSAAGVTVGRESALRQAAVWACVRLLAEDVASLPVQTFTRDGERRQQVAKPRWMVAPNPEFNWFEVVQQLMAGLLTDGNGPLEIVRDRFQEPVEVWNRDPRTVELQRRSDGRPEFRVTPENGSAYTVPWENMLYVRGFMLPGGTRGLSPLSYARESIGEGIAAQQFGAKFFSQGAYAGGLIEVPGTATQEQVNELVTNWKKHHQGYQNAHKPGVLTGGAQWRQVTIPPQDAQFIESRKFSVGEIARFYRVPPHKIGDLTNATFSNIEHQAIEYVVDGIRPWLVRLEAALNVLLRPGVFPKWNVDALLRGDTKSRYDAYSVARNSGWLSADEIRSKEDLNPIGEEKGGDVYLQPLNMAPLGTSVVQEGNGDA